MTAACVQDADAAAAAAMRATEGAVKAEMEAKAVFEQVKFAVAAAEKSRESLMDEQEAEAAEAAAAAAAAAEVSDAKEGKTAKKVRRRRCSVLLCRSEGGFMLR